MTDILLGIIAVAVVSAGLFLAGVRLARRASWRLAVSILGLSLCALIAFLLFLWDNLLLARLLPFSNLIVLGNWQPPIVAFLIGVAYALIPGGVLRKSVLLVPFALLSLHKAYGVLLGDVPRLNDRWIGDACIQTSDASCSAAAAATLLRAHGIDATESEMAELCLTRETGTTLHGLYRGLKRKTASTSWDVEVFRGHEADLRQHPGPSILTVGLPRTGGVDPRYHEQWGWAPGLKHTVVFFGFASGDKVDIADPSVGREQWFTRDLRVLWRNDGLRLVHRQQH